MSCSRMYWLTVWRLDSEIRASTVSSIWEFARGICSTYIQRLQFSLLTSLASSMHLLCIYFHTTFLFKRWQSISWEQVIPFAVLQNYMLLLLHFYLLKQFCFYIWLFWLNDWKRQVVYLIHETACLSFSQFTP